MVSAMADVQALGSTDEWLTAAISSRAVEAPPSALIGTLRQEAAVVLSALKRPGRKDEAWRRTDLAPLWAATLTRPTGELSPSLLERSRADIEEDETDRPAALLVFVDGVLDLEESDLSHLPDDVIAGTFATMHDSLPGSVAALLQRAVSELPETNARPQTALGSHVFAALNQASLSDVALVYVPPFTVLPGPVRILSLSSGAPVADGALPAASLPASHPNLFCYIDEGADAKLMQQFAGEGAYFTNGLTRVLVGTGATLEHSYVQEQSENAYHIDSVFVECLANSRYAAQVVQTGGRLGRLNLNVNLAGRHATGKVDGLSLVSNSQVIDVHSAMRHGSPDCESEQGQYNAAAGRGRVVFRGAVQVPHGCGNTTANQICRSLLLSDRARVDVAPTLEILTDDVQCTHGATIADLDDEMVFYLQSRGLDRLQARSLLLSGWAYSSTAKVPSSSVRRRVAEQAANLARASDLRKARVSQLSSI